MNTNNQIAEGYPSQKKKNIFAFQNLNLGLAKDAAIFYNQDRVKGDVKKNTIYKTAA